MEETPRFFEDALTFFFVTFICSCGAPMSVFVPFRSSDSAMEPAMPTKPFAGPKLKISRAECHINELEREISEYLKHDPFAVLLELNIETGKKQVSWRGREDIPERFSAIFGDAVHNLRAALDILANDVVALSGTTPKKVYFPFGMGPQHFEEQLLEKMKGAAPDILDIIRSFKPYPADKGGDEFLRSLHDLDIQDKHIAFMRANAQASFSGPLKQVESTDPKVKLRFVEDFDAVKTVKFNAAGYKIEPNIEILGKVANTPFDLVIAPDLPLQGWQVLSALDGMRDAAKRVVEVLETHCLRP
ncbi:MAG: hypothetical protein WA418_38450 [Bradyrhizobium sp.]